MKAHQPIPINPATDRTSYSQSDHRPDTPPPSEWCTHSMRLGWLERSCVSMLPTVVTRIRDSNCSYLAISFYEQLTNSFIDPLWACPKLKGAWLSIFSTPKNSQQGNDELRFRRRYLTPSRFVCRCSRRGTMRSRTRSR